MRPKWVFMSASEKFLFIARTALSACVIIFSALQLLNIWTDSIWLTVPLLGAIMVIQTIQEWKYHRTTATMSLVAAIFLFGCTAAVYLI